MWKEFLKRLTSRKFLLALGAFLTAVANNEWMVAMAVVLGYLGVEGANDVVKTRNNTKNTEDEYVVTPNL